MIIAAHIPPVKLESISAHATNTGINRTLIMDIIFAFDSIPAIFLITQDVFVIYTSNIFAILGLRALYFLLAAAVNQFTYLKPALSIILIFIGCKIFLPYIGLDISAMQSLCVTLSLITGGIVLSICKPQKSN